MWFTFAKGIVSHRGDCIILYIVIFLWQEMDYNDSKNINLFLS